MLNLSITLFRLFLLPFANPRMQAESQDAQNHSTAPGPYLGPKLPTSRENLPTIPQYCVHTLAQFPRWHPCVHSQRHSPALCKLSAPPCLQLTDFAALRALHIYSSLDHLFFHNTSVTYTHSSLTQKQVLERYRQNRYNQVTEEEAEACLGNIRQKQTEQFGIYSHGKIIRSISRLIENFWIFFSFFSKTAGFVFQSVNILCQERIFRGSLSLLKGFT